MLEDLLTNMTSSPAMIGAIVAGVAFFVIGRASKGGGARKREDALKRELLDAKSSVPQLESNVRNRDQQISRLQEEVSDLNDRTTEMLRSQDMKDNALRKAEREIKNLSSELNVVRGVRQDSNSILMDGFDDDVTASSGDSAAVAQLKKLEGLYDKLKDALIKRDTLIEELEAKLAGQDPSEALSTTEQLLSDEAIAQETRPLEDKISGQAGVIESLQEQISELRKEKEMLEDLANRRSRSNRALKDATAEVEARVPDLEKQIAEREETISAREASIKKLLGEADAARSEITSRDQTITALKTDIDAKTQALETSEQKQNELQASVSRREERITALDSELATTLGIVKQLQTDLQNTTERLTEQQTAVDRINTELERRDQAEAALRSTISDRDFRIDTLAGEKTLLESELQQMREQIAEAERMADGIRQEAEDNALLSDKRKQAEDSERDVAERQAAAQQREIEDLKANLAQHEQWMTRLKASLEDRENRSRDQQERLDALRSELDTANEQLRARHDERQTLEDSRHELEREIVTLKSRIEQTQAELAEQAQTVSVYKSMLADKDFRIDSLEQEIRSSTEPTESALAAANGDSPHPDESPSGQQAIS